MARRSSILSLPEPVRASIDAEIRANRLTLDEIMDLIGEQFGATHAEELPSRSAVGRYAKSERERMQDVIEAQETSRVWADTLGNQPQSQMGKVLQQLLTTLAWKSTQRALDAEDVPTDEIAKLARAYRAVEEAGQISDKRERELRAEEREAAAEQAETVARSSGMSATSAAELRRKILMGESS